MTTRTASAFAMAATVCAATAALAAQAPPAKPAPPATDRRFVVIGCVSRQAASGGGAPSFVLNDTRGAKPVPYRLDGDQETLTYHVGHYVEAAGSLSAPSGANANPTMKVSSLVYISKTCPK
jgi:hypothetical protein